ncbi:MAG TPA: ABC-2 family transporter protein, partial [Candidatus Bathyarchaeia archaeon]|nr:ABC-2 family transporter protein [Candidatus Bathyarchaeia archaeon]
TGYAAIFFTLGKIVRFLFFFAFIFVVIRSTNFLAGYNSHQVIFFFLVFNIVDLSTQFLFRAVYGFRPLVVRGEFDFYLVKPLPSFFRPLFAWADVLDLVVLVPLWIFSFYFVFRYGLVSQPIHLVYFLILYLASLIIGFAFHLFVASVCVLTTEIDHMILVYRDLINMARFPTDIYPQGVRWVLTFVIPVALMITIPAKALLGLVSFWGTAAVLVASLVLALASLRFWKFALTRYSSASS